MNDIVNVTKESTGPVNEEGYATESFPNESTTPQGNPRLGKGQATLALVNGLLLAFKAYEKASSVQEKACARLWEEMAKIGRMTREEGEPIIKEFLKLARGDKEKFPQAVSTAEQYASRIRKGWSAGVAPAAGEGANAFYKRAMKAAEPEDPAPSQDAQEGIGTQVGGERAKLMVTIRQELAAFTNEELLEVAKWLAHKNSKRAAKQEEKKAA